MDGNPKPFVNLDRDEFFYWSGDGTNRLCLRTSPTSFYDLVSHDHYKVKDDGSYNNTTSTIKHKLSFSLTDLVIPVYVELRVKHFK